MYRLMIARSGSYYVQTLWSGSAWKMVGPFYKTRRGAENLIRDLKYARRYENSRQYLPGVVAYY